MSRLLASWSGGKDSTAQIIVAHEMGIPIDEIVFCEVMYDLKRGISAENPSHIRFIKEICIPKFAEWGYPTRILRADTDFLTLFYKRQENPTKHPEHKGLRRGFMHGVQGWCYCKRDLKVRVIERFYKTIDPDTVTLVGICADEPRRLESLRHNPQNRSLLAEQGVTQKLSKQICEEYGLYSPAYEFSKRGGCWFCPFAKPMEQAQVPQEIWDEFCSLEKLPDLASPNWQPFRGGETLAERSRLVTMLREQQNN